MSMSYTCLTDNVYRRLRHTHFLLKQQEDKAIVYFPMDKARKLARTCQKIKMRFSVGTTFALFALPLLSTYFVEANKTFQVNPGSNIAAKVAAAFKKHPTGANWSFEDIKFALKSLVVPNDNPDAIDLDLRPASAFDEHSTYSLGDGESHPVVLSKQVLVSADPEDIFSVLAVDLATQNTHGFFQSSGKKKSNRSGKVFTVSQRKGGDVETVEAAAFQPPAWHCGVDEFDLQTFPKGKDGRLLDEGRRSSHSNYHHNHDHSHHGHQQFDLTSGNDLRDALLNVGKGLRGSQGSLGRRLYYTDNYPKAYTYQVDLFIEIDQAFEDNHGSYQAALEYIDVLVSAASAIYEQEIDTHLHVSHVEKTNRYDGASSTSEALSIMRTEFAGTGWHYNNIDLHHALLGNKLGGGIAYVGALCNSQYGFGLSGNLAGNFQSLGASTVWDLTVVAHEIGHNFDSGHTHSAYSPSVDTCGNGCATGDVPDGSATIMSYCHQCGGMSKVSYTFGGARDESGNWQDVKLAGNINNNPSRVAKNMHEHVSSRGSCVLPTHEVPNQECGGSTCDDNDACTIDSCIDDACVNTLLDCDDGNVCTDDSCDANLGCTNTPVSGASSFELVLNTDDYGGETSWELFSSDMTDKIAFGNDYASISTFAIEHSICSHPCFVFVIKDAWGDGMCCGHGTGSYTILIDGVEIHSGGEFGSEDSFEFCLDASDETAVPSVSPSSSPSVTPSTSPSVLPSSRPTASPVTLPPSSSPVTAPTGSSSPPPSFIPSSLPSSAPALEPRTPGSWVQLFFNDFEAPNQWGDFIDGLDGDGDARRYGGGTYAHSGIGAIKLRDNSGMASSVYTNDFDVSQYGLLRVAFWFYARSFDTSKEDFFLEYSTDGGATWLVIGSWVYALDFQNDIWYQIEQEFDAFFINTVRLRFRCDASGNGDNVYIDDVLFTGQEY